LVFVVESERVLLVVERFHCRPAPFLQYYVGGNFPPMILGEPFPDICCISSTQIIFVIGPGGSVASPELSGTGKWNVCTQNVSVNVRASKFGSYI
jgi:hypothetical protein